MSNEELRMKRHYTLIILLLFAGLWMAGCSTNEPPEPKPVDSNPKTLIIYGNIGEPYFSNNVRAAGQAVAAGALIEGQRVIVCHEKLGAGGKIARNIIYELVRDKKAAEGFRRDTLKVYEGENVKQTLDPADMKYLLEEMRGMAPANHYGLAIGTHATGWIPTTSSLLNTALFSAAAATTTAAPGQFQQLWEPVGESPLTRYIGHTDFYKNVYRIGIEAFADAVGNMEDVQDGGKAWDFVLFDACLMGSVEAVYEMRNIADYLIVSPAEVLMAGFPYDRVVKVLFNEKGNGWTNLEGVCAAYMDHYAYSSATVSLVRTAELEKLALTVRDIRLNGYNEVNPTAAVIQYFEGLSNHVFYDLDDYMRHWARSNYYYNRFYTQLCKTLPYTGHTPYFSSAYGSGGDIRIHCYSGLTAFIPYSDKAELIPFYHGTSWYKAIYQ